MSKVSQLRSAFTMTRSQTFLGFFHLLFSLLLVAALFIGINSFSVINIVNYSHCGTFGKFNSYIILQLRDNTVNILSYL